jgi:beta-lactamase class D
MKSLLIFLLLAGCASVTKDEFTPKKGCFLLYDMKTKKFVRDEGSTCQEQVVACSTFKVPLAVMAFDSGVLKYENEVIKWDGTQHKEMHNWDQDQTPETWMRYSVVWVSQKLTPKIGEKRLQKYLHDFHYGNEDLTAGITQAWLESPWTGRASLRISPMEQVRFMESLWNESLPVSKRSMELTQKLTFLEKTPAGFEFSGKTGSNWMDEQRKTQLGWFIAHLEKGDKEYVAVLNLRDAPHEKSHPHGGPRAKALMIELLKKEGLW